jgi:hypothetical protein
MIGITAGGVVAGMKHPKLTGVSIRYSPRHAAGWLITSAPAKMSVTFAVAGPLPLPTFIGAGLFNSRPEKRYTRFIGNGAIFARALITTSSAAVVVARLGLKFFTTNYTMLGRLRHAVPPVGIGPVGVATPRPAISLEQLYHTLRLTRGVQWVKGTWRKLRLFVFRVDTN